MPTEEPTAACIKLQTNIPRNHLEVCNCTLLHTMCFLSKPNTEQQLKAGLHLCYVARMFTLLLMFFLKCSFKQRELFGTSHEVG